MQPILTQLRPGKSRQGGEPEKNYGSITVKKTRKPARLREN